MQPHPSCNSFGRLLLSSQHQIGCNRRSSSRARPRPCSSGIVGGCHSALVLAPARDGLASAANTPGPPGKTWRKCGCGAPAPV
eukprot:364426-Chlamydomonas_euryale.AAC.26